VKALAWHGKRDVRVEEVPNPEIRQPLDAVVRITSSGLCGSDLPMLTLFDKQIQLRMGQANVRRWVPDILPLLGDDDPLGVDDFATHQLPLAEAPRAYEMFQRKADGAVKVVLRP
jgi:threonine dehydrogenase-like Zn-dependent dehydrogenase